MEIELLVFQCSNCFFGIRAAHVREVLRAVAISPHPTAHPCVAGMINLRGQVIPVVNLSKLVGIDPRPLRHTDHFVVIRCDAVCFAMHVDRALELLKVGTEHDCESPDDSSPLVEIIVKTSRGLVQVVDPLRIVNDSSLKELATMASAVTATETSGQCR